MSFLTPAILAGEDWRALELAVARLMAHCGWHNVQDIARSGDKGADILAVRNTATSGVVDTYLVQVKSVSSPSYVGKAALQQAIDAQGFYKSKVVVLATNGSFYDSVVARAKELRRGGFDVRLWNGKFLEEMLEKWSEYSPQKKVLRKYQETIVEKIVESFSGGKTRGFFVVATGLGKTVIAATIADHLFAAGLKKILVLCHSTDLIQQLQRDFWSQLSREIPTRIFYDGAPPVPIEGINFGLYQTLYNYLGGINPDSFDLIIVDEAHHAMADGFVTCMNHLQPKFLMGMTATPWRGDGAQIAAMFGEPIEKVSLADGMRMGFLAKVDYRLMCDNIDWTEIPKIANKSLSIKDLNKRLFLPQRDDAIIDHIIKSAHEIPSPRIAIFSPSISHADEFAKKLSVRGLQCANVSIEDRVKRKAILMDFSAGRIPCVTSVDVLNEGIDVPEVNILVFLRATHSRRIFVQQLGRGLRINGDKKKVVVLDFVSDIRRIAAVMSLNRELKTKEKPEEIERLWINNGIVNFSNAKAQAFIDAWLEDVADLEEAEDAEKLSFPEIL